MFPSSFQTRYPSVSTARKCLDYPWRFSICGRGNMLIGYMQVSKADSSQTNNLQRDALIAAGVDIAHLYEDRASGK